MVENFQYDLNSEIDLLERAALEKSKKQMSDDIKL
jgi:hypothetical protein